jgi:S1-C subfamily serine protease
MIKWNGKALPDVESWMPLLSEHKPGDKVEIVLVRDGKEVTVTAELQARGGGN